MLLSKLRLVPVLVLLPRFIKTIVLKWLYPLVVVPKSLLLPIFFTPNMCTPQTVHNALKSTGMISVAKQRKPLLVARHRKARLEMAKKWLQDQGFKVSVWPAQLLNLNPIKHL